MSARYTSPEAREGLSSKATRVCREGEGEGEGQKRVCVVMRFTSPALSRQLAEAGLEQGGFEALVWDGYAAPRERWARHAKYDSAVAPGAPARALDLTDVLEELTREREGGPLLDMSVDDWSLSPGPNGCYRFSVRYRYPDRHTSEEGTETLRADEQEESPAEAAGLVLLALLGSVRK